MKKFLLILLITIFAVSCGPHRMACGPRGICEETVKSTKKPAAV